MQTRHVEYPPCCTRGKSPGRRLPAQSASSKLMRSPVNPSSSPNRMIPCCVLALARLNMKTIMFYRISFEFDLVRICLIESFDAPGSLYSIRFWNILDSGIVEKKSRAKAHREPQAAHAAQASGWGSKKKAPAWELTPAAPGGPASRPQRCFSSSFARATCFSKAIAAVHFKS